MQTATKRQSYHHGDLATALIEATLQLVWEFGPRGFSMSQACKSAGVSPTAIYRHFASKEALLAEVARRGFLQLQDDIRAVLKEQKNSLERLCAIGIAYVDFAKKRPAQFEVMFMAAIDKHCFPETECEGLNALQLLVQEIHLAVETGELDPSQEGLATQMLWSLVHGLAVLQLDELRSGNHGPIEWDYPRCIRTTIINLLQSGTSKLF